MDLSLVSFFLLVLVSREQSRRGCFAWWLFGLLCPIKRTQFILPVTGGGSLPWVVFFFFDLKIILWCDCSTRLIRFLMFMEDVELGISFSR